ncbi:hypothetical protein [uncultured Sphingomonas sp.]|uniref:hypothetical protein n=1 Tax=uncultured Sphingomonas sp. TaxID=158754 RepID=UPI0026304589|nr:hypothetical protein [uncultured Sphingomonas sp.]
MRPKAIISAEWLYLAATLLLIVTSAMAWSEMVALYGAGLTAGITAFLVGLYILLILCTTRGGSRVALGLLAALTVVGLVSLLYQVATGVLAMGLLGVLNTVQGLLTFAGLVLLFRPNALAWFRAKAEMAA